MFERTRLAPPPKRAKTQKAPAVQETKLIESFRKEEQSELTQDGGEGQAPGNPSTENSTAPFGKLASKMKLMLRRRSTTSDKKKEKKEKDYYSPEEDLHWTEM